MNYDEIEEDIKKMISNVENSSINTLEVEFPSGLKVKMGKGNGNVIPTPMPIVAQSAVPAVTNKVVNNIKTEDKEDAQENYKEIKSPMVGTFYASSSPKAEPFVKVGDKIKKGQVVCIVEAMKLMNEIESEFDGEVIEVCKKDEDMVEYGTTLFKVK